MARDITHVRGMIARQGIGPQDRYDLPASEGRFPDGAHYHNEIIGEMIDASQPELGLSEHGPDDLRVPC